MATVNPIQIQKFLKGMDYPAAKDDLVSHAEDHGADDETLDSLEQLPDQEYETPADVSKALGDID